MDVKVATKVFFPICSHRGSRGEAAQEACWRGWLLLNLLMAKSRWGGRGPVSDSSDSRQGSRRDQTHRHPTHRLTRAVELAKRLLRLTDAATSAASAAVGPTSQAQRSWLLSPDQGRSADSLTNIWIMWKILWSEGNVMKKRFKTFCVTNHPYPLAF